uniref:Cyanobacterial aminoacyl-tRNA synthetase CAAD domain-containing protein n=1 Tax=Rhodosorus marinus TaxID=101924 RepID=A0A7S0BLZ3_9RHOD|mmetsp:Transcript_2281/g.3365  ORF Transcript_2281/g.3365 Transcript_2281/m.3365 type:complete len:240 (+) Transcript_2281:132-851(+)
MVVGFATGVGAGKPATQKRSATTCSGWKRRSKWKEAANKDVNGPDITIPEKQGVVDNSMGATVDNSMGATVDNSMGATANTGSWLSGMSMKGEKQQEAIMEPKANVTSGDSSGRFRSPIEGLWVSEADGRRNQNVEDSEVEVISAELVGKMKTTMGEAAQEVKARPTKYLKFIVFGAGSALVSALFRSVLYSVGELPVLQDGLELIGLGYTFWFIYRFLAYQDVRADFVEKVKRFASEE